MPWAFELLSSLPFLLRTFPRCCLSVRWCLCEFLLLPVLLSHLHQCCSTAVPLFLYWRSTDVCVCVCCSGWVTALSSLRTDKAVGAIMIIVAILFTFCASLSVVLFKMVRPAAAL